MRHDPQRFMGKTVNVPHFNRDTFEYASRKRNESKPGIKTLLPFLKNLKEESDLENFPDLIAVLDACYWLHKVTSISLSRFGGNRGTVILGGDFLLLRRFYVLVGTVFIRIFLFQSERDQDLLK